MKLLISLLLILPLTALCQKKDTIRTGKISIGLSFSPDYCYRYLSAQESAKWIANHRDSIENPMFGYTAGINAAYRLNKRITFEAGFLFSDRGEKYTYDFSNAHPINPNDPFLPIFSTVRNHYYYIDIPIKVNVNLISKRSKFYIFAGMSPNIFIKSRRVTINEFSNGQTRRSIDNIGQPFSKINFNVIGGLGFSYDLIKHLYIKAEPIFRLSLNKLASTPIKQYEYSAGINIGLFYQF